MLYLGLGTKYTWLELEAHLGLVLNTCFGGNNHRWKLSIFLGKTDGFGGQKNGWKRLQVSR